MATDVTKTDLEKAWAWLDATSDECDTRGIDEMLAAYGAHCVREAEQVKSERDAYNHILTQAGEQYAKAEQERDVLAAQVAELRSALELARKEFTIAGAEFIPGMVSAYEKMDDALAFPTTPRVQQVATGMALADSVIDLSQDGTPKRHEAFAAHIAAKEAAK